MHNRTMSHIRLAPQDVSPHVAALLQLQRAAYAVEAALIQDDRIPGLRETAEELIAARLHWIVDVQDGEIIGAIGYVRSDDVIEIDRLIVDPGRHRQGIGRRLVMQVLEGGRRAVVSTGRDNGPARRLYETVGFTHLVDREVVPGLVVSDYALAASTGDALTDRAPSFLFRTSEGSAGSQ